MSLHPLNNDQLALLNEYKASNLSILEFVNNKGISIHQLYYLINKERRLKAESMSMEISKCKDFVPVPIENKATSAVAINKANDLISFKANGINISIDAKNLKQLLEVISHD